MNDSPLEQRLRQGLAGAADSLPEPPLREAGTPASGGRSRRPFLAAAAAAAIVLGGVAVFTLLDDDSSDEPAVTAAEGDEGTEEEGADTSDEATEETPEETTAPAEVRVTNGQVPGEAVLVDDEIRFYGPDGQQTGSQSVAPLAWGSAASSDLDGGWVVCGRADDQFDEHTLEDRTETNDDLPEAEDESTETGDLPEMDDLPEIDLGDEEILVDDDFEFTPVVDALIWFPADAEPVVLQNNTMCIGVTVVDSDQGPILVTGSGDFPGVEGDLSATVLATGETYELPVEFPEGGSMRWAATSDRLLAPANGRVHLYDLNSGEELEVADISVDDWAFFSLAPDGKSMAVADGDAMGETPISLIVYDLETGEELYAGDLYQDSYMPSEGLELSYDGTKAAVGNYYDTVHPDTPEKGPTTVVDIASGEQYTVDALGPLP